MIRTLLLASLLLLPGCGNKVAAAPAGDGALDLVVGGKAPSLAADLRSMGVELLPPVSGTEPRSETPPAESPADQPVEEPRPDSPQERPQDQPTPPAPSPQPQWREVVLEKGQTIGALAKQHLGTSRRYQEILDLNHLTEAAARRIKAGTKIRVPIDPKK